MRGGLGRSKEAFCYSIQSLGLGGENSLPDFNEENSSVTHSLVPTSVVPVLC
jgi:hypothetical protein